MSVENIKDMEENAQAFKIRILFSANLIICILMGLT